MKRPCTSARNKDMNKHGCSMAKKKQCLKLIFHVIDIQIFN